jgi:hypothetical protein
MEFGKRSLEHSLTECSFVNRTSFEQEASDPREEWMRHADQVLEDENW